MKSSAKFSIAIIFMFLLCSVAAFADNITIYDGNGYIGSGPGGEDGETEPGMVNNQSWDLEGFFVNDDSLTMIGGYNFLNGETGNGITFLAGDIFLAVDQDLALGYNYVFDIAWDGSSAVNPPTYTLYQIGSGSFLNSYYPQNQLSDPWRYVPATNDVIKATGTITYAAGLTDAQTGFLGGLHNSATVDLTGLGNFSSFYAHNTMGCGNDNLMGQYTAPVPEPSSVILLGLGLVGLAGYGFKRKK